MPPTKMIAIALLAALPVQIAAQHRKLEVVGLDRDLERTAHHLGTSVEQVRQARELLEKATDLALQSDLDSSWPSLTQLGWIWRRAHPRKAVSTIDKLLETLKATARETEDRATYEWCVAAAHSLLQNLLEDSERLEAFLEDWPRREDLGDTNDTPMTALEQHLQRQRVLNAAEGDPRAAAELLRSGRAEPTGELLSEVARRLEREGQREAAQRLLAERIAELAGAPDSPENTLRFLELLHSLAQWHPDLIAPALQVLNSRQWSLPAAWDHRGVRLENSRGSIQLDALESMLYSLLRDLANKPESLLAALESLPSLKAKLDSLGGFDKAGQADVVAPDPDGHLRRFNLRDTRHESRQFRYVWGEADRRPAEVRRRLAAVFPKGLDWALLSPVQSHCAGDPAFSKIGLDLLRERFFENDDPDFSRRWLRPLLAAHSQCEGRAERSLIEFGFRMLDEAEQGAEQPMPKTGRRRRGQDLEHQLLVEWSRLDFDAASQHVRQLEDPAEKFKVYLAMAESRIGR